MLQEDRELREIDPLIESMIYDKISRAGEDKFGIGLEEGLKTARSGLGHIDDPDKAVSLAMGILRYLRCRRQFMSRSRTNS